MIEENYRQIDAVNQSTLKMILSDPAAYKLAIETRSDERKEFFDFGSLVDTLLTEPENVDKKFYSFEGSKPKPDSGVYAVIQDVFKQDLSGDLDDVILDTAIVEAAIDANYGQSYKPETLLKKVREYGDYYRALHEGRDKYEVTADMTAEAQYCVDTLQLGFGTKDFFKNDTNFIYIPKIVLTFEIEGIKCKAELDGISIDLKNKVIRIFDIKTTADKPKNFDKNFWKFRYDFQGAFYIQALLKSNWANENGYGDYTVEFYYLVASRDRTTLPMAYLLSEASQKIGLMGGIPEGRLYSYEGIAQAFNRLKFHTEAGSWDYVMEYYKQSYLLI